MVSPKGSVVTIIPSTGSPKLADALASLSKQDYPNVDVYLVVDGKAKQKQVQDVINAFVKNSDSASKAILPRIHATTLAWNVGAGGFFGHRIYAAFSHLVNHEFVTFLDEDNWYRPNHISSLIDTLDHYPDAVFAYSLREIYRPDGEFVANDDCESLGDWPVWRAPTGNEEPEARLADVSSYLFRRKFLITVAHHWHRGWGIDRAFVNAIRNSPYKYACSGKYTLAYRLGGNPDSVPEGFFTEGNALMHKRWKGNFPWAKRAIYPNKENPAGENR
jgi:glycosyltransferase involved in cell wall biosynthesis